MRADNETVIILDGDELREVFNANKINVNSHKRENRLALAFQYSHLCRILVNQGITVVIATISLLKEIHLWNRLNLQGYFEVYIKVPLEELRRRDPKGIYRQFDSGEITDVAGLDLSIDEPNHPDFVIEFEPTKTIENIVTNLMKSIKEKEYQNEN